MFTVQEIGLKSATRPTGNFLHLLPEHRLYIEF